MVYYVNTYPSILHTHLAPSSPPKRSVPCLVARRPSVGKRALMLTIWFYYWTLSLSLLWLWVFGTVVPLGSILLLGIPVTNSNRLTPNSKSLGSVSSFIMRVSLQNVKMSLVVNLSFRCSKAALQAAVQFYLTLFFVKSVSSFAILLNPSMNLL